MLMLPEGTETDVLIPEDLWPRDLAAMTQRYIARDALRLMGPSTGKGAFGRNSTGFPPMPAR